MDDSGRCKSRVASGQTFGLIADLNQAAAFQNEIELVLALVRVRGVFLTRLKGVQASKEKSSLHYSALSHPFGRELRQAGDLLYDEHDSQFTGAPHSRANLYVAPSRHVTLSCSGSTEFKGSETERPDVRSYRKRFSRPLSVRAEVPQ
jgi:hypothetical protein